MATNKIEELRMDIDELAQFTKSAKRPRVRDLLTIESRKLETELIHAQESVEAPKVDPKPGLSEPKCYEVKLTSYAWDQSEKFVKIFVTQKNVQTLAPENIYCTFTERGMTLHIKGLENRNYFLPITNLLDKVNESASYWKVKTDMVVVFIAKGTPFKNWPHLTASEVKEKESKITPPIDTEEDPYSGLMSLMKKMYEEGDDDMKRTIAKAWTESREKK